MFNLFHLCRQDEISFDIVAETGDIVGKKATMSKQHSAVSKKSFNLQHSTMLLRHCCWCGRGLRLTIFYFAIPGRSFGKSVLRRPVDTKCHMAIVSQRLQNRVPFSRTEFSVFGFTTLCTVAFTFEFSAKTLSTPDEPYIHTEFRGRFTRIRDTLRVRMIPEPSRRNRNGLQR